MAVFYVDELWETFPDFGNIQIGLLKYVRNWVILDTQVKACMLQTHAVRKFKITKKRSIITPSMIDL